MTACLYGDLTTEKRKDTTHGVLRMNADIEARWSKEFLRPALTDLFRLLAVSNGIDVLSVEGDGFTAEVLEVVR